MRQHLLANQAPNPPLSASPCKTLHFAPSFPIEENFKNKIKKLTGKFQAPASYETSNGSHSILM
jgi:hypothetical protein